MALSQLAASMKDRRVKTPTMQHRHFAYIAAIIADMPDDMEREKIATFFGFHLKKTNPNFDRARFEHAATEFWNAI